MNSSWDETRDGGLLNEGCWTGGCCTNALSVPIKSCVSLTENLVSVVCFFNNSVLRSFTLHEQNWQLFRCRYFSLDRALLAVNLRQHHTFAWILSLSPVFEKGWGRKKLIAPQQPRSSHPHRRCPSSRAFAAQAELRHSNRQLFKGSTSDSIKTLQAW